MGLIDSGASETSYSGGTKMLLATRLTAVTSVREHFPLKSTQPR